MDNQYHVPEQQQLIADVADEMIPTPVPRSPLTIHVPPHTHTQVPTNLNNYTYQQQFNTNQHQQPVYYQQNQQSRT